MALSNFSTALEQHKHALGYTQYWRYKGGKIPRLILWLANHPELARALADDAEALAQTKGRTADDTTKGGEG